MTCDSCYRHILQKDADKPPKFAISNGEMAHHIVNGDMNDILASSVSRVRTFSNFYSYSAGAHKEIKDHHVFFLNDPEHMGASFEYLVNARAPPDIYVVICGCVTPAQHEITRRPK